MGMPDTGTQRWTREMVLALRGDVKRYELFRAQSTGFPLPRLRVNQGPVLRS